MTKLEQLAEKAVMVCPQCEGEGSYADGLDEAACSTECARCGGNGWIVDLAALRAAGEVETAIKALDAEAIYTAGNGYGGRKVVLDFDDSDDGMAAYAALCGLLAKLEGRDDG